MSINITNASGKSVAFDREKLIRSLRRSQAGADVVESVADEVEKLLREGMSTHEIYRVAFGMLKRQKKHHAARYKLKQAIFELGPTGFPFEQFVAALFTASGFNVTTNLIVQGKCVNHEVDVMAETTDGVNMMECKFHRTRGSVSDVKIALYVSARFKDIESAYYKTHSKPFSGWLVTNTRLTEDAIQYASCAGLNVMGWNYPAGKSLRDLIDRTGLHPVTSLTTLTATEKQTLLDRKVVLCKTLCGEDALDHIPGISATRKTKILEEAKQLCSSTYGDPNECAI